MKYVISAYNRIWMTKHIIVVCANSEEEAIDKCITDHCHELDISTIEVKAIFEDEE